MVISVVLSDQSDTPYTNHLTPSISPSAEAEIVDGMQSSFHQEDPTFNNLQQSYT